MENSTPVSQIVRSVLLRTDAKSERMWPLYAAYPGVQATRDLSPEAARAAFEAAEARVKTAQIDPFLKERELQQISRGRAALESLLKPPEEEAYVEEAYEGGACQFVVSQFMEGPWEGGSTVLRGAFVTEGEAQAFVKGAVAWLVRTRGATPKLVREFCITRVALSPTGDADALEVIFHDIG